MTVQVYFIRHGIAADRGEYADDGDRPLTPKGRAKTQAIAHQLRAFGLEFSVILTSPLIRACQTAEILRQEGLSDQIILTDTLAPLGSFTDWLNWLKTWNPSRPNLSLALVGHEPDLSQWAELLIWGEVQGVILLKKSGMIGITIPNEIDPVGNCILFWLAPPKFLLLS